MRCPGTVSRGTNDDILNKCNCFQVGTTHLTSFRMIARASSILSGDRVEVFPCIVPVDKFWFGSLGPQQPVAKMVSQRIVKHARKWPLRCGAYRLYPLPVLLEPPPPLC